MSFPAYDPASWTSLFEVGAGASATLTGLVFVAVSINLGPILKAPGLVERALEPVVLLLGVLVTSLLVLIPRQGDTALGVELVAESLLIIGVVVVLIEYGRRQQMKRAWLVRRSALAASGTVPLLIGAVSLLTLSGGGLVWIVAGVLGSLVGAIYGAWIVLVQIVR